MKVLGIDIGGTGIKGAVVDTDKGTFASDRIRIETPHPATPEAVAAVVAEIVQQHGWDGPAGACFPGVVKGGTVHTAPNLDPAWVGRDAQEVFQTACGLKSVKVLNDADAAGLGEAHFGKPERRHRTVLFLTLGTGIGSALVYDGALVPNTELGHLLLHGMDAEKYAAESIREKEQLSYEEWAGRLSEYLQLVENLLWPDVFVLGGGISKHPDPWLGLIQCRTEVRVATLANKAGIIGAALDGQRHHKKHHG